MNVAKLSKRFCIDDPRKFRLADIDPGETGGLKKDDAHDLMKKGVERLAQLQQRLYENGTWAFLTIFQGMDAAGKDGAISHVMSGVDPQGCRVTSFKAPSTHELAHDFLWRASANLPPRGQIGIFNRSYYEEVLVVRVHDDLLVHQQLPKKLVTEAIWQERFEDICSFEKHLARSGTAIVKFHLRISKDEQKKRFLDRIGDTDKQWKFNAADMKERALWDRYMDVYEDAITKTSTADAPWYVIPADHKWFARLMVAQAVIETLERLDLTMPELTKPELAEMDKARKALERD